MKYRIKDITEAFYGCEEPPRDGPHALLYLEGRNLPLELSEKRIAELGIDLGDWIYVSDLGEVKKA